MIWLEKILISLRIKYGWSWDFVSTKSGLLNYIQELNLVEAMASKEALSWLQEHEANLPIFSVYTI